MLQTIQTARLYLVPYTLELKQDTLTDRAQLAKRLGVHVPEYWPLPDYAEALPFFIQLIEHDPKGAVWDGIIIHQADQQVIGDMGFKGGPDEKGMVEIGYSIIPEYRRQGYATEMARALIDWAFQRPDVTNVTAECLDDNIGSRRVLEHIGMLPLLPEGNMLRWRLERDAAHKV